MHIMKLGRAFITPSSSAPHFYNHPRLLRANFGAAPATFAHSRKSKILVPVKSKFASDFSPPSKRVVASSIGRAQAVSSPSEAVAPTLEGRSDISRAIIIGGSITGIFSAAVAAPYFDEVVVLEKDHGPTEGLHPTNFTDGASYLEEGRNHRGVPQITQLHALLAKGWDLANSFIPGFEGAALSAGAVKCDVVADVKEIVLGSVVHHPAASRQLSIYLVSRLLLQQVLRDQLLADFDNIKLQGDSVVQHLQYGNSAGGDSFLTGVSLKGGATLPADLVVDASGRRSKLQEWLLEGGFSPPRSVEVDPHMGYTTAIFDLPPKVLSKHNWKFYYVRPNAPATRGVIISRVEHDRVQIAAIGYGGDYPPASLTGMTEFLDSLRVPDVTEIMRVARPVYAPLAYRGATNLRHYYEEITIPSNLIVLGDAVACFNPAYGQGMTAAALQVAVLQKCLKNRATSPGAHLTTANLMEGFSSTVQKNVGKAVDFPFNLAVSEDQKYATTAVLHGEVKASPLAGLLASWFQMAFMCAVKDKDLAYTLRSVGHMVDGPDTLFSKGVVFKIMSSRLRQLVSTFLPL